MAGMFLRGERRDIFAIAAEIDNKYTKDLKDLERDYNVRKNEMMTKRWREMLSHLSDSEVTKLKLSSHELCPWAQGMARSSSLSPSIFANEKTVAHTQRSRFSFNIGSSEDEEDEEEEEEEGRGVKNGYEKSHSISYSKRKVEEVHATADGHQFPFYPSYVSRSPFLRSPPSPPERSHEWDERDYMVGNSREQQEEEEEEEKLQAAALVFQQSERLFDSFAMAPPSEENRFFELCPNQFGRGADAACTVICFYACMSMMETRVLSPSALSLTTDRWDSIIAKGCSQWLKLNEQLGRSGGFMNVDDLKYSGMIDTEIENLECLSYNGPLFEEQSTNFSKEDKEYWVLLKRALHLFYDMEKGISGSRYDTDSTVATLGISAVLTINGISLALWGGKQHMCIFDPHGSASLSGRTAGGGKATLEVHDNLDYCYKRCLTLCRSTSRSFDPSLTANQYTMYTFKEEKELALE